MADEPHGDVTYADPGYQPDGQERYPVDAEHVEAAWSSINQASNAAPYTVEQLAAVKTRIRRAMETFGHHVTEAAWSEMYEDSAHPHAPAGSATGGQFTTSGSSTASRRQATKKRPRKPAARTHPTVKPAGNLAFDGKTGAGYGVRGGDSRVRALQAQLNKLGVKDAQGKPLAVDGKYGPRTTAAVRSLQQRLGLKPDGVVTPQLLARIVPAKKKAPVKRTTHAVPPRLAGRAVETVEAEDTLDGRVVEALGTDDAGGRVFRVRIIRVGESKNGRRYPARALQTAAPQYEGAKAYDHHRTAAELQTSTINGLVGSYRNVGFEARAAESGLFGDLHLLPSATHTAEALDASLDAQKQGLQPLVGISHDVLATYRTVNSGGRRMQEATAITKVNSADVVADPAAGGIATRMVAGGIESDTSEESDVTVTTEAVLAALSTASDDELAAVGLARTPEATEADEEQPEQHREAVEERSTEPVLTKNVWGRMAVKAYAEAAQIDPSAVEALLPAQFTESDISGAVGAAKGFLANIERTTLRPTVTVQVTQEAHQKKVDALDAFFAQDFTKGYRSFKEAFVDITGRNPKSFSEDFNRVIMQESVGGYYDSDGRIVNGERSTESLTASTWNLVLGDSITRRLVAEYDQPSLQSYKAIVSSTVPVNDFRTQRIDRIGGYGTLPAVNQGAPYNPLTSPTNEEVTYALTKRGGTEDLTLEMIANDDVRAISRIPKKLGLAAAQTLFRFVWDFLDTNPAIYDSVTLFNASHGSNTATNALSQSNLSAGRLAMRSQTAYGDTANNLSIIPKTLIVVNDLEELAFQLTTSAVAVPATPAGPSDTPNLHRGLDLIIPDYWSSSTKWILVADTNVVPTFELGFYQGREQPELFTQSDPTVGSMFNADTLTMKIRHIYSGAVLDFRGFYRGNT